MLKADVLAKLNEYKDSPVELSIDGGGGNIVVYGNLDGRWLFDGGQYLVAVAKNVQNGSYDLADLSQMKKPFNVLWIDYEDIVYIKTFIPAEDGAVEKVISSLTPLATSKSMDDLIKEITSDSIYKAQSTRGYLNTDRTVPGTDYGTFKGSIISTSKDGIPKSVIESLVKE